MLTVGYFKSKNYEIATENYVSHLLDLRLKSGRNLDSMTEKYSIQTMFSAITEQSGCWRNSKGSVTQKPVHNHSQFHSCQPYSPYCRKEIRTMAYPFSSSPGQMSSS